MPLRGDVTRFAANDPVTRMSEKREEEREGHVRTSIRSSAGRVCKIQNGVQSILRGFVKIRRRGGEVVKKIGGRYDSSTSFRIKSQTMS